VLRGLVATRYIKGLPKPAVLSTLLTDLAVAAEPQTFTTIEFPGARDTRLFGITPSGKIVGLYINPDGRFHGFMVDRDGFTSIDFPGAIFTVATGINPAGTIVGSIQSRLATSTAI
jgi:hypothetical protein